MRNIYVASDNIITSLGFTTAENMNNLKAGKTGIQLWEDNDLAPAPFWASRVNNATLANRFSSYAEPANHTRFEQLVICSVKDALKNLAIDPSDERTLCILSSTKGNVDLLDGKIGPRFEESRVYLWNTAKLLQHFFNLRHTPLVVSNACISGVLAIIIGSRLIRSGKYDHIIVTGADLVTEFVLSGFNSFMSLCTGPCKPFDKDRQGLSLGEAAGTIILTGDRDHALDKDCITVGPGFSSNDANHISGPSRTGEGLYIAIKRTLEQFPENIDYISAHGTATPYNDEMESIAITRSELQQVPVNSLKGYWGHTLGAAGIIESVAAIHSLQSNTLINTLGFNTLGVTHPVAVVDNTREASLNACLKIASGFGGSNASLIFSK